MKRSARAAKRVESSASAPTSGLLHRWGPAAVGALAFLLRWIYLAGARDNPLFENLGLDARFYDLWAKRIAAGDWIGSEPFFMGPLYPYVLAVLYRLGVSPVFQVAVVQAVIDSVTCALVYVAARRIWAREATACVAGVLACFYGPMMLYTGELLYPTLAGLLHVLFLCLVLRREENGRAAVLFLAGVVLGIAAFGKATALVFYPGVVAWWFLRRPRPTFGRLLRPALLLLAGIAVVVLPITARNRIVGNDWVLVTSNAGLNFYIGNNPMSSGGYLKPAGLDVMKDPEGRRIAEAKWGGPLKPSEVSRFWFSEAGAFVREHPGRFASHLLKKTVFFWGAFEIPQIENFGFQRRYSPLCRLPFPTFGWIVPLALVGLILGAERRRWALLPMGLTILYSIAIAVFFVTGRYRMAVVPYLIILAAGGILYLALELRSGRRRYVGPAVLILAAALAHWNPYHVDRKSGFGELEYRLGLNLEKNGDLENASMRYRRALELDPDHPGARLNLGVILSRTGRPQEAREMLEWLAGRGPDNAKAEFNLGVVLANLGEYSRARDAYARALRIDPTYLQAWHGYGVESYRAGEEEEADRALERVAAREGSPYSEPWVAWSQFLLEKMRAPWDGRRGPDPEAGVMRAGDILAMTGDWAGAYDLYHQVAEARPSAEAYYEVGVAAYKQDRLDDAEDALARCVSLNPRLPGVHLLMGSIYVKREDFDSALRVNEREAEISPTEAEVFFKLGLLYENHSKNPDAALRAYRRYLELGGPREAIVRERMAVLEASE